MYIKEIKNKNGSISYKARINHKGIFLTKTFPVNGNQKRSTKKLAENWCSEIEFQIDSGMYKQEYKKHNYTLKEAIDKYINDGNPKKDDATRRKYIKALDWFKSDIGNIPIKTLDRSDIKQSRDRLRRKKKEIHIGNGKTKVSNELISNTSVNRYLSYFSCFLSYCVYEYEIITNNPCIGAKLKLPENPARERWMSQLDERQNLLSLFKEKNYKLYLGALIMLTTGARNEEVVNLTWENVDIENRAIYFINTKNGDNRTVAIPDILFEELKQYKMQSKVRNIKKDLLFQNSKCDVDTHLFYKKGNKIIDDAGLNKNVIKSSEKLTLYNLRHTYTSIGSLLGINTDIMDKITGHRNGRMTARYTHADCESLREPMNKIANYMLLGNKPINNNSKKINR